jgi:hypothetical protein
MLRLIQNSMQHILLALPGNNERASVSVIDDGVGEGDPLVGRFRRIIQPSDPSIRLAQKLMTGEKGTSVSVGTHSEKDQVKDGESGCVLLGKETDELFLVLVR